MLRRFTSALGVAFLAASAAAQVLTIGNDVATPNQGDLNLAPVRTAIDLQTPATGTGSVTTAQFVWSNTGCSAAVKIKFFRRNGNTLTLIAERGPFNSGPAPVTLSPAVSVLQGDLIGITRVANCGNASALGGIVGEGYVAYASDVTGSVNLADGTRSPAYLAVKASGTITEQLAGVIPVVGSTAGGFGSTFKTQTQFFNSGTSAINGRLVYHPAGTSGSPSDPQTALTLAPKQIAINADIVAALGQTGIGSIDVILPAGAPLPLASTRVYNDAGAAGTSGLSQDLIDMLSSSEKRITFQGATGFLITPSNPTKTRFNIGVRTFYKGAILSVRLRDAAGNTIATTTKTYQPNYFEQVDAATFLGHAISGNESIEIAVSSGGAVVYGSTTDNTTNDPDIQFLKVIFAIA